jgi:hypothetical protein
MVAIWVVAFIPHWNRIPLILGDANAKKRHWHHSHLPSSVTMSSIACSSDAKNGSAIHRPYFFDRPRVATAMIQMFDLGSHNRGYGRTQCLSVQLQQI